MATATKSGAKPAKAKPAAAAKPVVKTAAKSTVKPAVKPAAKPVAKAAVAKPVKAAKPAAAKKAVPSLPPEQRRFYVEVAAYYIAERRGFHGGSELNDWVDAENEIDRLLREGVLKP
jgi:hypothetical protein